MSKRFSSRNAPNRASGGPRSARFRKSAPASAPAYSPNRGDIVPEEFRDSTRGLRIQKALANLGVASRRECEELVLNRQVMVNGQIVAGLPAWVDPDQDRIQVKGHLIARPRKVHGRVQHAYLMLNKPRRTISTTDDPQDRRHVLDLVPPEFRALANRLYPVGRLDADTTGLILLTNDGELAHRLTHPRFGIAKEYQVSVRGRVEATHLERLKLGAYLGPTRPNAPGAAAKKASMEKVSILGYQHDAARGDRTALHVTLQEGQNREIRRLLAKLGFKVRRLQRVAIGPLRLKGVPLGQCRPLTALEINSLRHAVDLKD